MQSRRKKYSVVIRPGGVPLPFGTGTVTSTPFGPTPLPAGGISVVPQLPAIEKSPCFRTSSPLLKPPEIGTASPRRDMRRGSSPRELMSDIDLVVSHEPGTRSSPQGETQERRRSVESVDFEDQSDEDKIEMQLLVLDDGERSKVMHQVVAEFQQKVLLCFDHYQPDLTLSCLRIVTAMSALVSLKPKPKTPNVVRFQHTEQENSLKSPANKLQSNKSSPKIQNNKNSASNSKGAQENSPVADPFEDLDVEEALSRELPNFTLSRLRAMVQQLLRHATLRQDGSLFFYGSSEESIATKSVQYFIWFFDFLDYLQELYASFVDKVFVPLFKYFQDRAFIGGTGRTHSMASIFSKLSQFSDSDSEQASPDREVTEEEETLTGIVKMRSQAKASLLQLSNEYKDIKSIYDTAELDNVSQRLSFIKERMEYLLDEEDEVDPEIYSEESGKMVEQLDMDFGTENLIRLVPDIMVKLKKAVWLARRWLELDDQRTKDIGQKAQKLADIEEQLSSRVKLLQQDINEEEKRLDRETEELSRLMAKEGRCDSLNFQSYNVETQITKLQDKLAKLESEKADFPAKLDHVVKTKNLSEFYKLKHQFERNKLERLLVGRHLVTLKYQLALTESDLGVEMMVRPSVIHCSNKLQDECERLEHSLREKRDQVVTIQRALLPVQEDRLTITNRLMREEPTSRQVNGEHKKEGLCAGQAVYLRTCPADGPQGVHGGGAVVTKPTVNLGFLSSQKRLIGPIPIGSNQNLKTIVYPL